MNTFETATANDQLVRWSEMVFQSQWALGRRTEWALLQWVMPKENKYLGALRTTKSRLQMVWPRGWLKSWMKKTAPTKGLMWPLMTKVWE